LLNQIQHPLNPKFESFFVAVLVGFEEEVVEEVAELIFAALLVQFDNADHD
jgi:hypothetical protein